MIKFDNVSFSYGKKEIFKNLNLTVGNGERICLFAPSGFGKSTILRLVMGLEKPTSGEINGIKDKKIAAVFQEDRLLPHKTVYENIKLFSYKENIEEVLNGLNLLKAKDLYPKELSGGMARRAAIARALCAKADIYIFDECFNGIDKENIEKTAALICKITEGKTVIAVTHSTYEAELLNTEIIRL